MEQKSSNRPSRDTWSKKTASHTVAQLPSLATNTARTWLRRKKQQYACNWFQHSIMWYVLWTNDETHYTRDKKRGCWWLSATTSTIYVVGRCYFTASIATADAGRLLFDGSHPRTDARKLLVTRFIGSLLCMMRIAVVVAHIARSSISWIGTKGMCLTSLWSMHREQDQKRVTANCQIQIPCVWVWSFVERAPQEWGHTQPQQGQQLWEMAKQETLQPWWGRDCLWKRTWLSECDIWLLRGGGSQDWHANLCGPGNGGDIATKM